jgi:hypothetical protein
LKRTCWEQRKNEKKNSPPLPPVKKKDQGILSACWAFLLPAWNFCFQNYSSPFLAWANTPIHPSYSLDEVPPSLIFCVAMSQFDWPIIPKTKNTMEAPQNRNELFKKLAATIFGLDEEPFLRTPYLFCWTLNKLIPF